MNPQDYWQSMPRFHQNKKEPFATHKIKVGRRIVTIRFESKEHLDSFIDNGGKSEFESEQELSFVANQKITPKTKSIWYPYKPHKIKNKKKYISRDARRNRYPVYIVSKGRWDNGLTTRALAEMGVSHYIVVEKEQFHYYQKAKNNYAEIIVLPKKYLDEYDTCDDLGFAKSKGPGAARNFCIDHSKAEGFNRHWVMDDNLDAFHYLTDNEKFEVKCASTLAAAEDFVDRFSNVPVAGMNYYSFCKKTDAVPPFVLNTRIYSCLLIDNNSCYRWRGRYNEDTDLSLRVLKDGMCTIQFNAFLCGKVTTQRMRGGNTDEFYADEGTLPKSQMLQKLHPDVASVAWRFNRWHHHVDYRPFKKNKLTPISNYDYHGVDDYGLFKVDFYS